MDLFLKIKRKIRFAYNLSWHYGPFNESKRCWSRKFELLIFIKTLREEFFGLKKYKFVWDENRKIYLKTSSIGEEEKRPIPWIEYCQKWQENNSEWMEVMKKHSWASVRHGTSEEQAALDADLSPLRQKGLPRESEYRVLENLKFKKFRVKDR